MKALDRGRGTVMEVGRDEWRREGGGRGRGRGR